MVAQNQQITCGSLVQSRRYGRFRKARVDLTGNAARRRLNSTRPMSAQAL